MEGQERIKKITFYPKTIIEYAEKKGFITSRDLEKDFGYEKWVAELILSDLERLLVFTSDENDFEPVEAGGKAWLTRKYKPTEQALKAKQFEGPIVLGVREFPVFAKFSTELLNEMLEVARVRGIELSELIEMAESNPTKFKEIADKRRVTILSEYTPEELRELARELRDFLPRDPKMITE